MNKTDELITFWAHLKPSEIAFADESREITFAELDKYTRKIGFMLKEKGIKRGEIVSFYSLVQIHRLSFRLFECL